eukprot:TRINITY_DN778_c0_g1_i7.p1 TRINITY_DN778_c0_g1~~TRINITY_DN778_c0_g1_i7.p1  ORF type:complete len:318 (+),score=92.49 TRINITY_DN778_c0_g1_i7:270-1223(+)
MALIASVSGFVGLDGASFPAVAMPTLPAWVAAIDLGAKVWTPAELWQCVLGQPPRPVHPLLAPWIPYVLLSIYIFGKPFFDRACGALGTTGKSTPFKAMALAHNLALCAYSAATAWYTWRITFSQFSRLGVVNGYCEGGGGWDAGLGQLGFLFYLSKYWELADTALLVVKRRQPSYLQVYHHAGTAYGAWLLCLTHVPVMFIFVGLNALVHTVMYFYYAATICGYRFPGKSGITSLQIGQFYFGILICMPAFFVRGGDLHDECAKGGVELYDCARHLPDQAVWGLLSGRVPGEAARRREGVVTPLVVGRWERRKPMA